MVTTAKAWKNKANQASDLELPSGNVALVRNPGMQSFLQAGIIPNDLIPIILAAIEDNQMPDLDQMKEDPQKFMQILTLVDNIIIYCVVEPPVEPVPTEGVTRDEETLYVDEVDLDDKMFIFQFAVGGTKDLEAFREQQKTAMAGVSAKPAISRPTKRASGPKARARR